MHTRRAVKTAQTCQSGSLAVIRFSSDKMATLTQRLMYECVTLKLWQAELTFIRFFRYPKKLFWISEKEFVISEILAH